MANISINDHSEYLLRENVPFFFLCDTVWMAFQKLSLKEWKELVRFRKEQGFDGLQISQDMALELIRTEAVAPVKTA